MKNNKLQKFSIIVAVILCFNMVAPIQIKSSIKPLTDDSVNFTAGVALTMGSLQQSIKLPLRPKDIPKQEDPVEVAIEVMDIPVVAEHEKEFVESIVYIPIKATAFCDTTLADGANPEYGALAGKREWLGRSVELYDGEYNYLGLFTFHDVGYGRSVGYGNSEFYGRKYLGTIEVGQTIDIWMETASLCYEWGIQDIYMVWK